MMHERDPRLVEAEGTGGVFGLAICAVVILATCGGMIFGGRALDAKLALDAAFADHRGLLPKTSPTPCKTEPQ